MKLVVTATTDHQFVGQEVDSEQNPLLIKGISIPIDYQIPLLNGIRFVSSNYIIDTEEVK